MDLLKSIGVTGLAVLVAFYLVRDVLGPLVKAALKRRKSEEPQVITPEKPEASRVLALELNWAAATAQIVSLETLLNRTAESLEHKIDTMLERLTEIRDEQSEYNRLMEGRIAKAETNIDNIKERLTRKAGG